MRLRAVHPLRFVDDRQLVALDLRHQRDFVPLHRDLVVVNLTLALRGEVSARSHRKRVGNESGGARHDHRVIRQRRDARANDAGDEPKVRCETVVESIHDVPKESARLGPVPRLARLSRNSRQCRRVLGRFARQGQRLATPSRAGWSGAMHVEVRLHFASLFLQQHREQKAGAEQSSQARQETRPSTRTKLLWRVAIAGEEIAPNHYVAVLDVRQTRVDILLVQIGFGGREDAIQIGGVCFVLPVVLEGVNIGFRHARRRDFDHR